jgi:hypothetical protein
MSVRESLPNLWQLLGGYFHEEWVHDSPVAATEQESRPQLADHHERYDELRRHSRFVIKTFVDDSDDQTVASVITELDRLLQGPMSEDELAALLEQLGNRVHYPALGFSAREWLSTLRSGLLHFAASRR